MKIYIKHHAITSPTDNTVNKYFQINFPKAITEAAGMEKGDYIDYRFVKTERADFEWMLSMEMTKGTGKKICMVSPTNAQLNINEKHVPFDMADGFSERVNVVKDDGCLYLAIPKEMIAVKNKGFQFLENIKPLQMVKGFGNVKINE